MNALLYSETDFKECEGAVVTSPEQQSAIIHFLGQVFIKTLLGQMLRFYAYFAHLRVEVSHNYLIFKEKISKPIETTCFIFLHICLHFSFIFVENVCIVLSQVIDR